MPVSLPNTTAEAHFPTLHAHTLDGHPIHLPAGLPAERTVVILGFSRAQQPSIEAWAKGMQSLGGANLPWLQLPVIDNPGAVVRTIVNTGMRHAIHRDLWPHIAALYTQKAAFDRAVGISSESTVHVLIVDRTGNILARANGDYSSQAATHLLEALNR
jgi:hypothetical protein